MTKVISIHEYILQEGISPEHFEQAAETARNRGLFNLPGLTDYYFLKHIRGTRQSDYTAIWIYENRNVWEKLWGKPGSPFKKEDYPVLWKIWENELLAPLLSQDPDRIFYASYDEI